ncbi:FMN-binding protein [Pseudoduganella violaceinigra]|uniref:FMN-binding protein n=1 Tax=Pseudoduganella violaceinigra TaxID=246602 RepID=UPI0004110D66|nr:FMN-binding protein [Pseudoduganella violaceinigra]
MTAHRWSAFFLPVAVLAGPTAYATDYLTAAQAQEQLFPGAQFSEQTLKFSGEQRDRIKAAAGVRQRTDEMKLWRAEKNGKLQGWLMVDEVIGKHEFITYATAIGADGKVIGVEIMSYRETHGGQVREQSWRKQFAGKSLSDPFKLDQDIQNISGATLSCRNVMDGVKRMLVIQQMFLKT